MLARLISFFGRTVLNRRFKPTPQHAVALVLLSLLVGSGGACQRPGRLYDRALPAAGKLPRRDFDDGDGQGLRTERSRSSAQCRGLYPECTGCCLPGDGRLHGRRRSSLRITDCGHDDRDRRQLSTRERTSRNQHPARHPDRAMAPPGRNLDRQCMHGQRLLDALPADTCGGRYPEDRHRDRRRGWAGVRAAQGRDCGLRDYLRQRNRSGEPVCGQWKSGRDGGRCHDVRKRAHERLHRHLAVRHRHVPLPGWPVQQTTTGADKPDQLRECRRPRLRNSLQLRVAL